MVVLVCVILANSDLHFVAERSKQAPVAGARLRALSLPKSRPINRAWMRPTKRSQVRRR